MGAPAKCVRPVCRQTPKGLGFFFLMITAIPPVETRYKSYRFRSRLEARWAVFFDALEIPWRYEIQDYVLQSGTRYLPDFWMPLQDCWIEIKGDIPTSDEQAKCAGLAEVTNKNVYCFFGQITNPRHQDFENNDGAYAWFHVTYQRESDGCLIPAVGWDNFQQWCECSQCGFFGIEYSGRSERLCCPCLKDQPKIYNYDTPRLNKAYDAARSARFEFGEEG